MDVYKSVVCFAPGENPYKVDVEQITQRAKLLQKFLSDEQKELQALYALQALMVRMEQPASKCSSLLSATAKKCSYPVYQCIGQPRSFVTSW